MTKSSAIISNQVEFLNFMKSKFPLYHMSNVFFRDIHYGAMEFLHRRRIKVSYADAEQVARDVIHHLEKSNILKKVNQQGWVLLYPDFSAKKAS